MCFIFGYICRFRSSDSVGTLQATYLLLVVIFGNCLVGSDQTKKHPVVITKQFQNEKLVVSPSKTQIWGPGLLPYEIVLPARYFYIQLVGANGEK